MNRISRRTIMCSLLRLTEAASLRIPQDDDG